jgi:hypothetical protein
MQIASKTITTTEGLRALHVALSEHAELAAQAELAGIYADGIQDWARTLAK